MIMSYRVGEYEGDFSPLISARCQYAGQPIGSVEPAFNVFSLRWLVKPRAESSFSWADWLFKISDVIQSVSQLRYSNETPEGAKYSLTQSLRFISPITVNKHTEDAVSSTQKSILVNHHLMLKQTNYQKNEKQYKSW